MIWVEKYRPRTMGDCILPEEIKKSLLDSMNGDGNQHFLFTGDPGQGKTSVAVSMCIDMGADYLLLNSSIDNGIDTIRTTITNFASTVSLYGNHKVIILDEADKLTQAAQPALRGFIEEFGDNCSFILTANYPNKIIRPLRESRLIEVNFDFQDKDKKELQRSIFTRTKKILGSEKIEYKPEMVAGVIKRYYPDIRRIVNYLQFHSASGTLAPTALLFKDKESIEELRVIIQKKGFEDMRKWANSHSKTDATSLFKDIFEGVRDIYEGEKLSAFVVALNDYMERTQNSINPEITLSAMIVELSGIYRD